MTQEKVYSTNIVLAIGLIIIALVFDFPWLIYVSMGVLSISVISNTLGAWIAKAWMGFGKILGKINASIMLSIFFILILVPSGFLKRLLTTKLNTPRTSTWENTQADKINFTKPW